jgi:hypothetical protein
MQSSDRFRLGIAAALATLTLNLHAALPPAGYVDFGNLPASNGEFVEVNVKGNLLSMVARLTQKAEPQVADVLKGLQAIRVNVIGLNDENRDEMEKRIKAIRTDLDGKAWEKIVSVQKANEDVGIYLKTRGDEAVEGLVITVLQGNREAVLINVVGNIQLDKLGAIGERLNLEPLKKIGGLAAQKSSAAK